MGDEGVRSGTVDAVRTLLMLLQKAESTSTLVEELAQMPKRVTTNHLGLVRTLSREQMESVWLTPGREPIRVSPQTASAAKTALEQVVGETVDVFEATGHL